MSDLVRHRNHREMPVEAEAVAIQVEASVLLKLEGVEGTVQAALEVAWQDFELAELRRSLGCLAPVTTASWLQFALVTAQKQARPSEDIALPGARNRLSYAQIASELKPVTGVILA